MIDRHRVNGSLARKMLVEMESKGLITKVSHQAALPIYTRATAVEEVKA
jgi:ribosomal protein S25